MARRQNKGLLHSIKRGFTSLFVCSVVLIPVLTLANIPKSFIHRDPRKVIVLPAFSVRAIDNPSKPLKPFHEPILSVTFDDGWETIYTSALPLLQKNGIQTTQYLLSGQDKNVSYMSDKQIKSIHDAGHEVACHTITHPDLVTLTKEDLDSQLTGCRNYFAKTYGSVTDFASPYGSYNDSTISEIKKTFRSHRNTDGDITNGMTDSDVNLAENFNPYNIIGFTIRRDTTAQQIKQAIDYTIEHNGWLVITYHEINEDSSPFGLDQQTLSQQLEFISKQNIRIATVGQVLDAQGVKK